MDAPARWDGRERRAPEPLLYSGEQLRGRQPIRLRRRSDKLRLAAHLGAVAGLGALSAWWVLPLHAFAGPVLVTLAPGRGIHAGDLPAILFLTAAGRSLVRAKQLLAPTTA